MFLRHSVDGSAEMSCSALQDCCMDVVYSWLTLHCGVETVQTYTWHACSGWTRREKRGSRHKLLSTTSIVWNWIWWSQTTRIRWSCQQAGTSTASARRFHELLTTTITIRGAVGSATTSGSERNTNEHTTAAAALLYDGWRWQPTGALKAQVGQLSA